MMCVGSDFAIVATSMIEESDKNVVLSTLKETGKNVIEISEEQVNSFAGNCLELLNSNGKRLLLISDTAFSSMNEEQLALLPSDLTLLPIALPTIEMGGGSVRCMVAGIHLECKTIGAEQTTTNNISFDTRVRLAKGDDLEGLLACRHMTKKQRLITQQKLMRQERPDYLLKHLYICNFWCNSFYSYKREIVAQRNKSLGAHYTHDLPKSHFTRKFVLLPEYRKHFNGKLLSKVRYLFMGLHQHVFASIYVLRGEGAVGRHFFPMTYAEQRKRKSIYC